VNLHHYSGHVDALKMDEDARRFFVGPFWCGHCRKPSRRRHHLWCWVKKFILRMRDPYEGLSDWTDDFGGGCQ